MGILSLGMQESLSKAELIEAVEREFADVTREGGVSWLEAYARDGGGSQDLYDLAKERDIETCWQELVDSTTWDIAEWSSNWSFLDPIGFRYYLAAAIIRELKSGDEIVSDFHFWFAPKKPFSAFTEAQNRVIAEFTLYKLLDDRKNSFPDMVGQPIVRFEPFSDDWKKTDSNWANAYLNFKDYLPDR